jgi:hypothetical protein
MLCRRCEALPQKGTDRGGVMRRARTWSLTRIRDPLCSTCSALVCAGEAGHRLLQKQSQLAQFGLAGFGGPLLEPLRPEDV